MAGRLTPAELQEVVDALWRNDGNFRATARELSVDEATVRRRANKASAGGYVANQPKEGTEAATKVAEEMANKDRELKHLRAKLREIEEENLTAAKIREGILGLTSEQPSMPDWTLRALKGGSPGIPVTVWSDWHWGEVVFPDQVGNMNRFNLDIAHERACRLVERLIHLCFVHTANPVYPGIVCCLGGDLISGDIHTELKETNEIPTAPTFLDLFGVLIKMLTALADKFGAVVVPVVAGNHGRMTLKPTAKNRAFLNWDWLMGSLLEQHFNAIGDDRFTFLIPEGTDAYFKVAGHCFLLTHGDSLGVRGGDGIIGMLGPVMRGDFKVRRQSHEMGEPYQTILMGHWHQYTPLPRIVVNGSLKGFDEFAKTILRASPERPQQALLFVHHQGGIIDQRPIFLDANDDNSREQAAWVEIPKAAMGASA